MKEEKTIVENMKTDQARLVNLTLVTLAPLVDRGKSANCNSQQNSIYASVYRKNYKAIYSFTQLFKKFYSVLLK